MTSLAASSSGVFDQPGTLGFLVVFGMAVLLYFVFRSMSRHLRKLNDMAQREEAAGDSLTTASGISPTGAGASEASAGETSAGAGSTVDEAGSKSGQF